MTLKNCDNRDPNTSFALVTLYLSRISTISAQQQQQQQSKQQPTSYSTATEKQALQQYVGHNQPRHRRSRLRSFSSFYFVDRLSRLFHCDIGIVGRNSAFRSLLIMCHRREIFLTLAFGFVSSHHFVCLLTIIIIQCHSFILFLRRRTSSNPSLQTYRKTTKIQQLPTPNGPLPVLPLRLL